MEFEENFSFENKEELEGKWLAVVDDVPEGTEDIVRYGMGLEGVVKLQSFTTCEKFLPRAHEFDICVLDGNFGPGRLTGPESVDLIRGRNPEIFIIGYSSEKGYNEEFKGKVDVVVDKMFLVEELPAILESYGSQREQRERG